MTGPCDKVTYGFTVYGRVCYVDRRTAAHLDRTKSRLPKGCTLLLAQGCFNDTVAASKGTHDFTSCVDVKIAGMSWGAAQTFLRKEGWAAWHRTPAQGFSVEHIHMISLGYGACRVGEYVDGGKSLSGRIYTSSQVDDYYRHSFGLKGQHASGADPSWFPANIPATVFDYAAYLEDDMASPKDWDDADWAAVDKHIWGRPIHSADERVASNVLAQLYVWLKPKK